MPEITSCPDCGKKLKVPDNLIGKQVKCPGCGNAFVAEVMGAEPPPPPARGRGSEGIGQSPRSRPSAAAPAPREPDEDYGPDEDQGDEGGRGGRGEKSAWKKVAMGTNFLLISWVLSISGIVIGILGGLLIPIIAPPAAQNITWGPGGMNVTATPASSLFGTLHTLLSVCTNLIRVCAMGLAGVAYFFYMGIPARTGARGLAMATLGLCGAALLCFLLTMVIPFLMRSSVNAALMANNPAASANMIQSMISAFGGMIVLAVLTGLLIMGELSTCALYFKVVAGKLKAKGLVSNTNALFITGLGAVAYSILMSVIPLFAGAMVLGLAPTPTTPAAASSASQTAGAMMLGYLACLCLDGVLLLGYGIWFFVTIFLFRGEIDSYIRTL
jgi:hypothetical protein